MNHIAIDIETYSSIDLVKSGVYRYVQSRDFTILLLGYSIDGAPAEIVDLACGEQIPAEVLNALENMWVLKTAYNAAFERTCLEKYLLQKQPPAQWECTMAKASMLGLPLSLDAASKVLKLGQEKMAAGKALIRYFSLPCKPTKANGERTRNLPEHDIEKWNQFKEYCRQDVTVEQAIREKISFFQIPETEVKLWRLDQKINDTGVLTDPKLVKNAIRMDIDYREKLHSEALSITKLNNPNSAAQLKQWISGETGEEITSLTKESIPKILKQTDCSVVKRVLQIRQEMAKTSVKKYLAMFNSTCEDRRIRGLLQYYGANRTGRWAGRLVQVQNLPQNHLPDLDLARTLVRTGEAAMLEMLFGNVPDTLSQLIRTAFIAPEGHRLIVADFSSIELVVAAWLAGEKWVIDEFNSTRKIYEQTAARMLNIPVEQITKGSPARQKGKIASLACQYGGGVNALIKMGAIRMGLTEDELPAIITQWRNANRAIVKYWKIVEYSAIQAVKTGECITISNGLKFFVRKGILAIQLPSGRKLCYFNAVVSPGKFGNDELSYEGVDQNTKKWERQTTYGGKIFENLCQAVARDCLADAMLRLHDAGYKIVLHVHDEVVIEHEIGKGSLEDVSKIMATPIPWAKNLPLSAEGFECNYYKK